MASGEDGVEGDLPSQHILSIAIPTCRTRFEDEVNRRKRFTAFVIEIRTYGGHHWTVERRYRQFYQLNQILKQHYAELRLFKFPGKKWFSSFATSTVEKRRRVFEHYLQELLCLQPRPTELNRFLEISEHVWGSGGGLGGGVGVDGELTTGPVGGGRAGEGGDGKGTGGGGGGIVPDFARLVAAGGRGGGEEGGGGGTTADALARIRAGGIGIDDFELLRVLGKGSFGKVFLVRLVSTGQIYAMKVLKKSEVARRRQVEHTRAERRIMGGIEQPFIVALRFAFQTADKLYMVTDYCRGGELFFHLKKFRTFPEEMVRFYAAELVSAMQHLHSLDVVYRDLKPENVLLDGAGHVKITDFGLSKDEVADPHGATTFCGTPEYLAPEMLINRKSRAGYGKAVDWWSLGTLLFEMLTGWPPFYDKNLRRMCEKILRAELRFPPGCTASAEARDLIRGLLHRDPNKRLGSPGAKDIRKHPFFEGIDWETLERAELEPPFVPKAVSDEDIANFDSTFTAEPAVLTPPAPSELATDEELDRAFEDFSFADQEHAATSTSSPTSSSTPTTPAAAPAAAGGGGGGEGEEEVHGVA